MSFPVFSLRDFEHADSASRRSLAATVDAICRETGFLAIRDHGVDQEVIDRA